MKLMQWIASWFRGARKSLGSLGVGLRTALGGGAPGGWASDHREETAHNTGFNYIAIHAIAAQVAGATVTAFADGDQQIERRSRRKSLAARVGTFTRWKSTYGADDRETDPLPPAHPLIRLLRRPNPYESGATFRYRQAQQIRLTGTCLVWNVPSASGRTCERYVIPTSMATPVPPTMQMPLGGWRINPVASRYTPIVDDGYVECPSWYRILGQIIDARQVQVIRLPHAWYLDDGQSPLSAGAKWVDAGEAVDDARYHQLRNGVDPSVVWNLPPDVSPDQDEMDRVQAKISAKYGGPENVGRVMVAQSGTSITPLSATPKDMCYTEGFHDFKAAVLALHQTPPVAVGLQEPGAYAAYNASMKAWRHSAVQPLCDMLAESDTEYLAPQFGQGLTVEIESDTVEDTELIEQQLQNDLAAKVRTKNEWRAVRGLSPLPGTQGEELVGTDGSPKPSDSNTTTAAHPESETTASEQGRADSTIDTPQPKALSSLADLEFVVDKSGSGPHAKSTNPPNKPRDEQSTEDAHHFAHSTSADADSARAKLISEILSVMFGSSMIPSIGAAYTSAAKAYDPKEPRDSLGRWTRIGSPKEVATALATVRSLLQEPKYLPPDKLLNHLSTLSNEQLIALHRECGVEPPPTIRSQLTRSAYGRLGLFPAYSNLGFSPSTRGNAIDVHLQNSTRLNELTKVAELNQGKPLTRKDWKQLVGAQPGARVDIFSSGPQVHILVDHPDYYTHRILGQGGMIQNVVMKVSRRKQGQGLAAKIVAKQVETARRLGLKKILTGAAGTGEAIRQDEEHHLLGPQRSIGYYAWARLGFDGKIEPRMKERRESGVPELQAIAADFQKKFPNVTRVSQMMQTKNRREWWKKFGGYFDAEFDLTDDSPSMRVLAKYLAEKKANRRRKSLAGVVSNQSDPGDESFDGRADVRSDRFADQGNGPDASWFDRDVPEGENPDPLSPEDEEILDRIWDQIGRETGAEST